MPPLLEDIIREYGSNPFEALWFLFSHGLGFITIVPVMIIYGFRGYMEYITERFKARTPYVLLHIRVPQMHEQNMRAVEQIFVTLYGTLDVPNREEKYWDGFVQENFSMEIVSEGGYLNFYIRTAEYYKDLTEAAFYAQYPDALLTVVEDYSKEIKADMIMDEKVQVYGSELKLASDDFKPIRSWPNWEHGLSGTAVDPLASILEVMSRMGPGERWWLQIMAQPSTDDDIKKRGKKGIDSVVEPNGAKSEPANALDKALDAPIKVLGAVHDQIWPGDYATAAADSGRLAERQRLTEPERGYVDEVDRKISRWPYKTKIRWMYIAPPNTYRYKMGRRGILGALQQFRFINWFVEAPYTRVYDGTLRWRKIATKYRLKRRARRMLWAYQSRDMSRGEHAGFILNTEELATIFHFPQIEVRAPFIAKATSRGVEPPTQLEFEGHSPGGIAPPSVRLAATGDTFDDDFPRVNITPEERTGIPTAAFQQLNTNTIAVTTAQSSDQRPVSGVLPVRQAVPTQPPADTPPPDESLPPTNLPFA